MNRLQDLPQLAYVTLRLMSYLLRLTLKLWWQYHLLSNSAIIKDFRTNYGTIIGFLSKLESRNHVYLQMPFWIDLLWNCILTTVVCRTLSIYANFLGARKADIWIMGQLLLNHGINYPNYEWTNYPNYRWYIILKNAIISPRPLENHSYEI